MVSGDPLMETACVTELSLNLLHSTLELISECGYCIKQCSEGSRD